MPSDSFIGPDFPGRHGFAQVGKELHAQLLERGEKPGDLEVLQRAHDRAQILFEGRCRPCGKPLIAHLVGTASILAWQGARLRVITVGLLHAAYTHGNFGDASLENRRCQLRSEFGEEIAEQLLRYYRLVWDAEHICMIQRKLGELDPEDREVLLVRLANELEDHLAFGMLRSPPSIYHELYASPLSRRVLEIAKALGHPELALALERAFAATYHAEVPQN